MTNESRVTRNYKGYIYKQGLDEEKSIGLKKKNKIQHVSCILLLLLFCRRNTHDFIQQDRLQKFLLTSLQAGVFQRLKRKRTVQRARTCPCRA